MSEMEHIFKILMFAYCVSLAYIYNSISIVFSLVFRCVYPVENKKPHYTPQLRKTIRGATYRPEG